MSYPPDSGSRGLAPLRPTEGADDDDLGVGSSRTSLPLMNGHDGENGHTAGKGDNEEEGGGLDQREEDFTRRYEDFTTVDWIQDSLHERNIRARGPAKPSALTARLNQLDGPAGHVWRMGYHAFQEGQSWVVISLVGVFIGLSAALISLITVWLSDMKMGYCATGWWLSQKFCCLELSDEGEGCDEWRNWGGVEPFRWIFYIIFAAIFSSSAAFLVRSFAPYAAGSGISEIKCILGGFIIKGFLGAETVLIKGLTLPLAIASGLSVGKEGPSVHVACAIGNVVARWFNRYDRSHLKMREIITASSAAGVAVAFGSPIGGVLFSIEEMNQTFSNRTMWQSFVCALVATFTLAYMDPFRTGKLVLFQVSYDRDWHYFEIPAYMVIGLFGGLYGAFVIKFNLQVAAFRRKHLANYAVAEAVTLATITGFIGYLNRFLRIDMTEGMEILFRECEGGGDLRGLCQSASQWRMVNSLIIATVVRAGLIVVSYGCKVPCGIFVPSMAVGATFGRMVGIVVKALQTSYPEAPFFASCAPDAPCITPGTYAFLGAAAALSGVTRLTVTIVVIMFELTGALTYILPTMIVLMVTKALSDQFGGHGMADETIKLNGYPFLEKEDKEDGDHAFIEPIANVMKKDIVTMYASGMPLQSISEIVQSTSYQGFPVVRSESDHTVIGFVSKADMRYVVDKAMRTRNISHDALCTFQEISDDASKPNGLLANKDIVIPGPDSATDRSRSLSTGKPAPERRSSNMQANRVDFGQYVDETPLTVSPKMPLEIVMQLFRRMGPRVVLVTQEGQLVGLVTVKDVLRHEAVIAHDHGKARVYDRLGHQRNQSTESYNGWQAAWADVEEGAPPRGLEIALEEGWGYLVQRGSRWANVATETWRGMMAQRRREGAGRGEEMFGYEMGEGRREGS